MFPALSPDGARLFFTSDRPIPGRPQSHDRDDLDLHIWVVDRMGSGWGEPRHLGPPIESPGGHEQGPSPAADGTLYFASDRPEGKGRYHLYRARRLDERSYAAPENLAALNGPVWDSQPAIAPDQSVLVFASGARSDTLAGRGASYFRSDLYASFRASGGWSAPRHLGPPINSAADESCPSFSPDGSWLYFTSERGFATVPMQPRLTASGFAAGLASTLNGAGNIYRIDAGAVRDVLDTGRDPGIAHR
jgi:Tol biopolymer transport system component